MAPSGIAIARITCNAAVSACEEGGEWTQTLDVLSAIHMAIYKYGFTLGCIHMAMYVHTWLYVDKAIHMAIYMRLYMHTHGYI